MGFWAKTGEILGGAVGIALGGPVKLIGRATGSSFVEEVGDGVMKATGRTGAILGNATEGLITAADGAIHSDSQKVRAGIGQAGGAVGDVARGVGNAVVHVGRNAGVVVTGAMNGDKEAMQAGARELAKAVAIGVISVGVVDFVADDVGDGAAHDDHFVNPHDVAAHARADGTEVDSYWRDGDGNTTVNRDVADGGGWRQSNPTPRS